MADLDPPSLGEVLRRLDDLQRTMADLIAEMKADRIENAKTYVRADVYNVAQAAQNAIVADLHRDVGTVDTNWRAEMAATEASLKADLAAAKAGTDAKFAVIETDRKADVAWRRTWSLGVAGLALTFVLTVSGFIINYLLR